MKQSFVHGAQDIASANHALMRKVQFLTSEKAQADELIKDLEQSLKINKEALRIINRQGGENKVIETLNEESIIFINRIEKLYEESRNLNTMLLFQSQIRIQDRSFYNQRVIQFENRISDLRKYLHDKEDSFTNVVHRLRKYQDINQMTLAQKLSNVKGQFDQDINKDIIAQLSKERNYYKKLYEDLKPNNYRGEKLQQKGKKNDDTKLRVTQKYEEEPDDVENQRKKKNELRYNEDPTKIINLTSDNPKKYPINPNKELIRLLKKEKMSNDILEEAFNDSLEKNQELMNYNQKLTTANRQLEQICNELRAQLMLAEGKISDYDENYQRKMENMSKCDMDKPSYQYSIFNNNVKRKDFLNKLIKDVEKLSYFMNGQSKKQLKSYSEGINEDAQMMGQESFQIQIDNL